MEQQILVFGEPIEVIPKDLYIPPEALRVLLSEFEGPLDLLLYLIRKENMSILDIEITLITEQYLSYIELMKSSDINLAAEYLLMAATLAEIKARCLLPKSTVENADTNSEEEIDPRTELVEQLLEYEKLRKSAQNISSLPFVGNGIALSGIQVPLEAVHTIKPKAEINKLYSSIQKIIERHKLIKEHEVEQESFSLSQRINKIETYLKKTGKNWSDLTNYCKPEEGKAGLIVTLMAMLELDKSQFLEWQQQEIFGEILIRKRQNHEYR